MPSGSNLVWLVVGILAIIILLFIVIRILSGQPIVGFALGPLLDVFTAGELGWCADCK